MILKFACFSFLAELGVSTLVPEANPVSLVIIYGPMGIMLAWFMLRSEKAMNTLSHRIDGMTRAMLVDTLSRENVGSSSRKLAEEMLSNIENRSRPQKD